MSETKPTTQDTASEQPGDPAFIAVSGDPALLADAKGRAVVTLQPDRDTGEIMHLRVTATPYAAPPGCSVAVRVILPAGKAARKLRRLATFARGQQRFGAEMDVEDELRAMEVMAKTLASLPDTAAFRVLAWLSSRQHTVKGREIAARGVLRTGEAEDARRPPTEEESIRIAKEHLAR